ISDTRLDVHLAVRFDHEQAVVSSRTGKEDTHRHAETADFGAATLAALRLSLVPFEELGPTVQRLLDVRARRVATLSPWIGRTKRRLAFRGVEAPNRHLIDAQLARRLGEHRLHEGDALHAARLALRSTRRGVGHHRDAAPPHGLWLIEQRNDKPRYRAIS